MFNRKFFDRGTDARQFFRGCGSFGEVKGTLTREKQNLRLDTADYELVCAYREDANGVFSRKDTFTNKSQKDLTVRGMKSRFVFEGGEYEVYTQFSNWQSESTGQWQDLHTGISIGCSSVCSCQNAAPFLVLWNCQEQRGTAFHLLPKSNWEISATRVGTIGKKTRIVVEMGIDDYNFSYNLAPGETLHLPEILCYEVKNKVHLDCYKLHHYMHTNYPRKQMPVIYNTWMGFFDHITYEKLAEQVPLAADLGVEYFFLDAGWFGKGANWSIGVGDWAENTVTGLAGRMLDLANEVRAAGMKFGVWLEPERANVNSDSVKAHPEYYLPITADSENLLLDFGNQEARKWMLGVLFDLIDHYGIKYIKDDFNVNKYFDESHEAFLHYHEGHREFVRAIRERYPDLYFSSCAGGGDRMELENYTNFDSGWPSDNESPYDEMEMYRHTILRLPPQGFERWMAIHSITGLEDFYSAFEDCNKGECERIVACGDATWSHIAGVKESYLKGFMTCGPIGFSCNLKLISPKTRAALKGFIEEIKENREFWIKAVARVLCDTKTVTVYQYSDMDLNQIVLQLFTKDVWQETCCVHPELDATKYYSVNGADPRCGKEIMEEGLEFTLHSDWEDHYPMFEMTLKVVDMP